MEEALIHNCRQSGHSVCLDLLCVLRRQMDWNDSDIAGLNCLCLAHQ
jgi:hypothetical protein